MTQVVNVNFNSHHVIITIPENFMVIDLIEQLVEYYSLSIDNYVYSLYLDDPIYDNFITSCCSSYLNEINGTNGVNEINEIDYLPVHHYLHEYYISGSSIYVRLVCEYKIVFNIKQLLRYYNLL